MGNIEEVRKENTMAENTGTLTELTDILDKDIEAIVAMRINAERKVSYHQRLIEKATSALGRPFAVYTILLIVALWISANIFHKALGFPVFDAPPFVWLQDTVSISALLMTVIVLATQNRQERFAEQRRHLDLQITLLTERKVSKVIELLENLRRDMPSVKNRVDLEAEAMQDPVDPHTALTALNQTLQEATKEYELEIE
ncbi:MAG: hypothetical protein NVS4B12_24010 [Ktedonobacteraceae bacterium]